MWRVACDILGVGAGGCASFQFQRTSRLKNFNFKSDRSREQASTKHNSCTNHSQLHNIVSSRDSNHRTMNAIGQSQRQQLTCQLLNINNEAIKCIEGQAAISSADHLVCSLLSVLSTSNFNLPSNVNKSLCELRKAIDDASICIEDDGDCEEMMENSNGDGDAFMSPAASSVDRPSKRHRSTDLCRTTPRFPAEYDEGMLLYPNPLALPFSSKVVLLIRRML